MNLPTISVTGWVQRVISLLPRPWFSDEALAPGGLTYAVLYGAASVFNLHLGQLQYWLPQTRIATATDSNLEAIANDYFGTGNFPRYVVASGGTYTPESDAAYSLRIREALLAPQNTLEAIRRVVQDYIDNVYGLATSVGVNMNNDTQGGLDTYGYFDAHFATLLSRGTPTVRVFDWQSDPMSAAEVDLLFGQFCIFFTFASSLPQEGFFLNHSYTNRGYYLLSPTIAGGPLTPQLGALVQAVKATGLQPLWVYARGV